MKKIGILIAVLILVFICVAESNVVDSTVSNVQQICNDLYSQTKNLENINTTQIINQTQRLNNYWAQQEHLLCFFINYKDMSEMSNEMVRMESYAKDNVRDEFMASLRLVLYYCETFDHITGFSLQNIF